MVSRSKERDVRERVQQECVNRIISSDYQGIVLVAPRVGKSKILIDSLREKIDWNLYVSSPYETIRENWIEQLEIWKGMDIPLHSICSRSLDKIPENLDLLVIDEIQTLSEKQIMTIKLKKPKRLLGLTGTLNDDNKLKLWRELKLKTIFDYSIDQAIEDGIISNFEVIIVECEFDDTNKNILSGTKKKSSWTTELGHYQFLTKQFEKFKVLSWSKPEMEALKMKYAGDRSRFIYSSNSKFEIAKKIVDSTERCLIFTGLQEKADLFGPSFHSNSNNNNLDKFIVEEINKLAVIEMVNMGITIPNLKTAIVHQLKSNSEMSLQKILRMCNLEGEKVAKIYLTVYKNSVDEKWIEKALETVNPNKIKRINYKNLDL